MAATPKNFQMTLQGAGGQSVKDAYVSDVAGALVRFTDGVNVAGSGSPTEYTFNSDGYIADISIATGLVDTTAASIVLNGTPTGNIIRWANFVNTLTNRTRPGVSFKRGDRLTIVQLA